MEREIRDRDARAVTVCRTQRYRSERCENATARYPADDTGGVRPRIARITYVARDAARACGAGAWARPSCRVRNHAIRSLTP